MMVTRGCGCWYRLLVSGRWAGMLEYSFNSPGRAARRVSRTRRRGESGSNLTMAPKGKKKKKATAGVARCVFFLSSSDVPSD